MFKDVVTSILGEEACNDLMQGKTISVILSNNSVKELSQYLHLTSNGSMTNMGAGNRIGNSIEDKKYPYGFGTGFEVKKK